MVNSTWSIWRKLAQAADSKQLGVAFIGYLIFTIFMTIGAMETHKVLFMIFVLIDFLFIGLSLSTLGVMPHAMHNLAAYSELLISLLSFYGSAAAVLNTHFGKVVLPVGKPFGIFKIIKSTDDCIVICAFIYSALCGLSEKPDW